MDGIVLVIVDGLMHGATNEPMASMLEDQVESNVGSSKNLFQSKHYRWTIAINYTIRSSPRWSIHLFLFQMFPTFPRGLVEIFFQNFYAIPQFFGILILIFELTIPSYTHVFSHSSIGNTFILIFEQPSSLCAILSRCWTLFSFQYHRSNV